MTVAKILNFIYIAMPLASLASCQSKEICNDDVAKDKAVEVAKSRVGVDFLEGAKIMSSSENDILKFEFYNTKFFGGGVVVYVNRSTCSVEKTMFSQ